MFYHATVFDACVNVFGVRFCFVSIEISQETGFRVEIYQETGFRVEFSLEMDFKVALCLDTTIFYGYLHSDKNIFFIWKFIKLFLMTVSTNKINQSINQPRASFSSRVQHLQPRLECLLI